jgi:hypothetical protein
MSLLLVSVIAAGVLLLLLWRRLLCWRCSLQMSLKSDGQRLVRREQSLLQDVDDLHSQNVGVNVWVVVVVWVCVMCTSSPRSSLCLFYILHRICWSGYFRPSYASS